MNSYTFTEDGIYMICGDAPGVNDVRGNITYTNNVKLITNSPFRFIEAHKGDIVYLNVSSGNHFTPQIYKLK